jgi:hypothetical protein
VVDLVDYDRATIRTSVSGDVGQRLRHNSEGSFFHLRWKALDWQDVEVEAGATYPAQPECRGGVLDGACKPA